MRKIVDIPPLARHALAIAVAAALVAMAGLCAPREPSQLYAVDAGAVAALAWLHGRSAALTLVAALSLLLAYYLLDGPGFAVSDPVAALGLVAFIFGGIVVANMVGALDKAATRASARMAESDARRAFADSAVRELSHRIGNDLAALAGVATMTARASEREDVRAALDGVAQRIQTVGGIYGRLRFAADSTISVDMAPFVGSLCADMRSAYMSLRPIALNVEVEPTAMSLDRAVLVGLILNELLTNIMKYAFPDDRSGSIWVRLSTEAAGDRYRLLSVTDDGVGLDGAPPKGTGFGQKLIRAMASQMEGRFSLFRHDGLTCAELRLPPERPPRAEP